MHGPRPIASGTIDGRRYFVMARVAGPTLRDTPRAALARDIALATAALHAHGVVHGDLAPANIAAEPVTFLDFGSAVLDGTGAATAATAAYTAPERWRGEPPMAASDMYALGAIVYQLARARAHEPPC